MSETLWVQLFQAAPKSGATLQIRLRGAIIQAVLDQKLPPGSRLPPSRRLAADLGVSRNTVTLAYQMLTHEGFVLAQDRSGPHHSPASAGKCIPLRRDTCFDAWKNP